MKKNNRTQTRFKLLLVAFFMTWGIVPATQAWISSEVVNGVTWKCYGGYGDEVAVSKATPATGALVIPSILHVNGGTAHRVTGIRDNAFSGCKDLTSVKFPSSVTRIGAEAFYGCTGLKDITIPDGVTSIGVRTFRGCTALTSITIPDNVTSIGGGAFEYCRGMTSMTIPDKVTSIGMSAFNGCTSLTNVKIGNSVSTLWDGAFLSCNNLTALTIPSSVSKFGKNVFNGCRLADVWFKGSPPELLVDGVLGVCNPFSAGLATGARGYYTAEHAAEWAAVIDAKGKWCGLIMSPEKGPDFKVRLHGNGVQTADGDEERDIEGAFGKDLHLPKNPFTTKGIVPGDVSDRLLGWSVGTSAFDWTKEREASLLADQAEILIPGEDDLLHWSAVTENGIPVVHLYAIWKSEVDVQVRDGEGNPLSPESLEEVVKYRFGYDDRWRTGGTTFLVPPGKHGIQVELESGFGSLYSATVRKGGTEIAPEWEGFWMFEISSGDGPLAVPLEVRVATKAATGHIRFDCSGLMTAEQRSACPEFPTFDEDLVEITLRAGAANGAGVAVEAGTPVALPTGTYRAEIGYKAKAGSRGMPYWCASALYETVTREVEITAGEKTESVTFRPFGSTTANYRQVAFDGNGGSVAGGPLWFGHWYGIEIGELSDTLPEPRRAGGWQFTGWLVPDGTLLGVGDWRALQRLLQLNPRNLTLQAQWKAVEAATGTGMAVPYRWLDENAADVLAANGGDYEAAAMSMAANDANTLAECYVARMDPRDGDAVFKTTISFVGDKPVVSSAPRDETARSYTTYGKKDLADADEDWTDVTENDAPETDGYRFFRVGVSLPEE